MFCTWFAIYMSRFLYIDIFHLMYCACSPVSQFEATFNFTLVTFRLLTFSKRDYQRTISIFVIDSCRVAFQIKFRIRLVLSFSILRFICEATHAFMETFTEAFTKTPFPIDRLVQNCGLPNWFSDKTGIFRRVKHAKSDAQFKFVPVKVYSRRSQLKFKSVFGFSDFQETFPSHK